MLLVGFVLIEGMCNRICSCIINEDIGLLIVFIIVYEMGYK